MDTDYAQAVQYEDVERRDVMPMTTAMERLMKAAAALQEVGSDYERRLTPLLPPSWGEDETRVGFLSDISVVQRQPSPLVEQINMAANRLTMETDRLIKILRSLEV